MIKRELKEKIVIYLLLVISLFSFIFLLLNINNTNILTNLDRKINLLVENHQSSFLLTISKIISDIFEPAIFIFLLLIITFYLFQKKRKKEAICLIFLTVVSFSLEQLIKIVTQRIRPLNAAVLEKTFSFPSGHAIMAIIFFGTLVYLFENHIKSHKKRNFLTILSVLFITLISSTRIYLNVHWFSDVLASFALGTFLLISYIIIIQHTDIFKTKQSF